MVSTRPQSHPEFGDEAGSVEYEEPAHQAFSGAEAALDVPAGGPQYASESKAAVSAPAGEGADHPVVLWDEVKSPETPKQSKLHDEPIPDGPTLLH